jgi:C_GCAxxG_C_C family probable redox protein
MQYREYINERVHGLYWNDDLNCAATSLLTFSEIFQINLNSQILDAAIGMPGAGRYGAQCGLVAGALMFIGIQGKEKGLAPKDIVNNCNNFAKGFEDEFGSLNCRDDPAGIISSQQPNLNMCRGVRVTCIFIVTVNDQDETIIFNVGDRYESIK